MARTFYDSLGINENMELDFPLLEGTGSITHDQSRNSIVGTFPNGVLWRALAAGLRGIYLHEIHERYIEAPVADTTALDFTSGDYSLVCWLDASHWDDDDMIIMGRYAVYAAPFLDAGVGWELYHYYPTNLITLRHHHGTTRTGAYSGGWVYDGDMHLFGMSRVGGVAQHYRDGLPIATTISAGGLIDPDTNTLHDLVVGCRYTKDTNFYTGYLHRPRAWSRALSAQEHWMIHRFERGWFPL